MAGAREARRRQDPTWSLALASRSKEQGQVLEATGAAQVEALAVGDTEVDEYVELSRGLDPSRLALTVHENPEIRREAMDRAA